MNREAALQEVKRQISCVDYLNKSKSYSAHSQTGYCCPICGSGDGPNGTGAVQYYPETNTWTCHACGGGHDVIDLYTTITGTDFNQALQMLAADIGIEIDHRPTAAEDFFTDDDIEPLHDAADGTTGGPHSDFNGVNDKQPGAGNKNGERGAQAPAADYTEYYKACRARATDPAAVSYLSARGISQETAAAFNIGYDPAADPAGAPGAMGDEYKAHPTPRLIIPCTRDYYIARSMDPATPGAFKAPNPKGSRTRLFNEAALYEGAENVFICEGWADALALIQEGAAAIATNGKGNHRILLDQLQARPSQTSFIIVPDNDQDPTTAGQTQRQAEALKEKLQAAGYDCIIYNVAGSYHDVNDELQADPEAVRSGIAAAAAEMKRAKLPAGMLTFEKAVDVFKAANDKYIEMPNFPEFCKLAKIKLHDSVVLAADTGAGKSSLAINFIDNLNGQFPCVYFNLEMDEITILRRLVSIRSGIDLDRIEGYNNDPSTAAAVDSALRILTSRKPLQIIQDKYNLKDIEAEIQRTTAGREDPTIVVIDHSLLIKTGETFSRYERFTQISEELRRISRFNNIVMLILMQQNREGKADEKKRPTNSSLKESGSWENDATHILFLWYNPETRHKELIITKNRGGSVGIVNLEYYKTTQFYQEAAYQPAARTAADKPTKRDRERDQLQRWYEQAYTDTWGEVTIEAMAEAGGVSTAVVKRRLKEFGGYAIDGRQYDAAGRDNIVEESEFIKLTPGEAPPFNEDPKERRRI